MKEYFERRKSGVTLLNSPLLANNLQRHVEFRRCWMENGSEVKMLSRREFLKVTGVGLAGAALFGAAGCGGGASNGNTGGSNNFVVGHTYPDLQNPYYISVRTATQQKFKKLGWEYIFTDSTQDPAKQVTDIENLVSRGVDLLFVDAVDPKAVVPGVKAANQANIPVVALIRKPAGGNWKSFVYLDLVNEGRLAGQYIVDQLNGKGNVVELQGIMDTQSGRDRSKGFNMAISAAPGIKVVAQQEANFERGAAFNAMEAIIQSHSNIDAVFGANDEEILGAIKALKSSGVDPKSKVTVGVDGTEVALKAMCSGDLDATVATIGRKEADIIVDLAKKIHNDKAVPKQVKFPDVFVTKKNVKEVIKRSGFNIDCEKLANS